MRSRLMNALLTDALFRPSCINDGFHDRHVGIGTYHTAARYQSIGHLLGGDCESF